jgi:hypothetical protein
MNDRQGVGNIKRTTFKKAILPWVKNYGSTISLRVGLNVKCRSAMKAALTCDFEGGDRDRDTRVE